MKGIFERTLIISPHYDDEVIGCGGLLSKLSGNPDVEVKIQMVCSKYGSHPDYKLSKLRKSESDKALSILGYDPSVFLSPFTYPDGYLDTISIRDLITRLDKVIKEYNPTAVLFPYSSHHQDHQILNKASIAALRPLVSTNSIRLKAMYEYPYLGTWSDTVLPASRMYVTLTEEELEKKKSALLAYESQLIRDRRDLLDSTSIVDLARVRGREIGQYAAEAYYPMSISF